MGLKTYKGKKYYLDVLVSNAKGKCWGVKYNEPWACFGKRINLSFKINEIL